MVDRKTPDHNRPRRLPNASRQVGVLDQWLLSGAIRQYGQEDPDRLGAPPRRKSFVFSSAGTVVVDERLTNHMQLSGGKAVTFKPTVIKLQARRTLEWLGRLGLPGIIDGRHRFGLHPGANGDAHLRRPVVASGLPVRIRRKSLNIQTPPGSATMNVAPKAWAEAAVGAAV